MVEIQKRSSRPLLNLAMQTPEARVFLMLLVFLFFVSIREKLRKLEFDFKQAVGYVDRIEKSVVFNYITIKEIEDAIYLLKNKGSNGDVGINNKTLAACKFCKSLQLFQPMR